MNESPTIELEDLKVNSDSRRDLFAFYNGEHKSSKVAIIQATEKTDVSSIEKTLLTLLSGSAICRVFDMKEWSKEVGTYTMIPGKRLFVPKDYGYETLLEKDTTLLLAIPEEWELVEKKWTPNALNFGSISNIMKNNAKIVTPFLDEDFVARQIKIAKMHGDFTLGGHYHPDYAESFTVVWANPEAIPKALFRVFNLDDPNQTITEHLIIPGTKLRIPPRHPHEAQVSAGTILIWATQKEYISPAINDVKYEFTS